MHFPTAYNVQQSDKTPRTPCQHCRRKTHRSEDCWELESNAHRRPRKWKSVKEGRGTNNFASSIIALAYTLDAEDRAKVINALQIPIIQMSHLPVSSTAHERQQWIIDSGASDHVTGEKSWFREYQDISPVTLYTADKRPLCAVGKGRIDLRLQNGNVLALTDVLYVPGFP